MIDLAELLLIIVVLIVLIILVLRFRSGNSNAHLERLETNLGDRIAITKLEIEGTRGEARTAAVALRSEVADAVDRLGRSLHATLGDVGKAHGERFDSFGQGLAGHQQATDASARALREELLVSFGNLATVLADRLGAQGLDQGTRLDAFAVTLTEQRSAANRDAVALRDEVGKAILLLGGRVTDQLERVVSQQKEAGAAIGLALKELAETNDRKQDALRQTVEGRLNTLRGDNEKKLEEMRRTVDEKLQGTLDERLGASFAIVNDNLDRVAKSVGEMQQLANGVGDLKRVLSNIKLRGTWGEGTLGTLLEQVLTPEQFATNVAIVPGSAERVEYAVKMPGDGDQPLWLPIDSKMPMEDYERLMHAAEVADAVALDAAGKSLERQILKCAQDISSKYIQPPYSTDFGVMFLPSEGLFAEVVRRPGLVDKLGREYRVMVTGPTTLMALLNSLRMGFRTLAIQERSSEVWQVLAGVKNEFGKFGPMLDKVAKKLGEAQNVVGSAQTRSRALERQLRRVETLPADQITSPVALQLEGLLEDEDDRGTVD